MTNKECKYVLSIRRILLDMLSSIKRDYEYDIYLEQTSTNRIDLISKYNAVVDKANAVLAATCDTVLYDNAIWIMRNLSAVVTYNGQRMLSVTLTERLLRKLDKHAEFVPHQVAYLKNIIDNELLRLKANDN